MLLLTRFPDLEAVGLAGTANVSQTVVPYLATLRKLKLLALPPRADTKPRRRMVCICTPKSARTCLDCGVARTNIPPFAALTRSAANGVTLRVLALLHFFGWYSGPKPGSALTGSGNPPLLAR